MIEKDSYNTLSGNGEGLYKEKGSKFIAVAFPVSTEEAFKSMQDEIRKKYYDARHHCYAYMLGTDYSVFRANDDGEPSGSAGKPILNQILSKELTNVGVIVVRYFGGTKLGVSGLIRAYKTAAREALDNAPVLKCTVNEIYGLTFDYPLMNEVTRVMKEENLEQQSPRFEMNCYFEISIRKSEAEKVIKKFINIYGLKVEHLKTL